MHLERKEWLQAAKSHVEQAYRRGAEWRNLEEAVQRAEELTDEQWHAVKDLFEPESWDGVLNPTEGHTFTTPDRPQKFWREFDTQIRERLRVVLGE